MFVLYEVAGIITNLAGGWIAARLGMSHTCRRIDSAGSCVDSLIEIRSKLDFRSVCNFCDVGSGFQAWLKTSKMSANRN